MITVIDETGRVQDVEQYKKRLIVPSEKQAEITAYLQRLEASLQSEEYTDKQMKDFLRYVVYSRNVLDSPFSVLEQTLQEIQDFTNTTRRSQSFLEDMNEMIYFLEKAARLGIALHLSEHEKRRIYELEDVLYRIGEKYYELSAEQIERRVGSGIRYPLLLIKMLSRHTYLGLSQDIDPQRKANLEGIFKRQPHYMYQVWKVCSAHRLGLDLPPVQSAFIEQKIRAWIEQNPEEQIHRELDYFQAKVTDEVLMQEYISTVHHLRRLFCDDNP